MMHLAAAASAALLALAPLVRALAHAGAHDGAPTALDRYVAAPDDSYAFELVRTLDEGEGLTTHVLDLVSQTWRAEDEVDRTVWRHWLVVAQPDGAALDTALLYIGGGRNGRAAPERADERIGRLARATGAVVAELRCVPNEPLVFDKDGVERVEDDLVAYTWRRYLDSGDETWPAQLPMVKSAVRAMDAVQAFLGERGDAVPARFVVAGGSKRGWTTWLTAAVDGRVAAIAPLVIDILNVRASMQHHFAVYGFWAPAIGDYVHHGITERRRDPAFEGLLAFVDPFAYRDRLTLPKLLVHSSGDQFFLPDSSRFYYDELVGEKRLRYVPNSDHSLRDTDALETLAAFVRAIAERKALPQIAWTHAEDGALRVTASATPKSALLWQATNPRARDFRLEEIGPAYKETRLEREADGSYRARLRAPEHGFSAAFVELAFDVGGLSFKLTTPIVVLPDVRPFEAEAEALDGAPTEAGAAR